MLTIILAIIGGILLFILAVAISDDSIALPGAVFLLVIGVIVTGIFMPLSGYEESEFEKEIELVSLSNSVSAEGGGMVYISVNAENVYSYRYETESDVPEKEGKTYKTSTISADTDVEILEVETTDGSKPVLAKYVAKGKKSIWTFALGAEKVTYVFYVPEGTIVKDIALT